MPSFRLLSSLLVLWIGLGLAACESSSGGGSGSDPIEIAGSIAADATWSGTVHLTEPADIQAGVNIHIAAGTKFAAAQDAMLRVYGSLWVDGTAQRPVSMEPLEGATSWAGVFVETGGLAEIRNVTGSKVSVFLFTSPGALECLIDSAQLSDLFRAVDVSSVASIANSNFHDLQSAAVAVTPAGDLTITDSYFWGTPADLVLMTGGRLTMSYCEIGSTNSTQHGDLYLSSPTALNISYCNILGAVYGIMIGGANQAVLQYNNFLQNDFDVGELGANTAVDMSFNYWDSGPPSLGAAYDFSSASPSPIAAAGPRG